MAKIIRNFFKNQEKKTEKSCNIWVLQPMGYRLYIRGIFKNRFLKSIKPHDLGSILSTSYFYSFTLGGL